MKANAQDTSLEALITAGRADIATGQASVEALLEQIIGEQDTAAAAEAAAASALAAIESLTTEQEAATADIATAYTASLTSIEVRTSTYLICNSALVLICRCVVHGPVAKSAISGHNFFVVKKNML